MRLSAILGPVRWGDLCLPTWTRAAGLLDSTLVVWMGEFRPHARRSNGRRTGARSLPPSPGRRVLAGGGVQEGGAGLSAATSKDGTTGRGSPRTSARLHGGPSAGRSASIPTTQEHSPTVGRPIRIAGTPEPKPVQEGPGVKPIFAAAALFAGAGRSPSLPAPGPTSPRRDGDAQGRCCCSPTAARRPAGGWRRPASTANPSRRRGEALPGWTLRRTLTATGDGFAEQD